jgi:hypothetical protein
MPPSSSSSPAPANKEWAEARFNALDKDVDEAKAIALAAKTRASQVHPCKQEDTIMEMKKEIAGWSKWWKVTMVSIIGGILTVVGFVWNLNNEATEMKQGVQGVKEDVAEVTTQVEAVQQKQNLLQTSLDSQPQGTDHRELRKQLKQAIREALDEDRPARTRRNRASGP